MKVLGKEKDFYDAALDYSNVEQETWFRDIKIFKINNDLKEASPEKHEVFLNLKKAVGLKSLDFKLDRSDFWGNETPYLKLNVSNGFILFAGKVYPFIKATDNDKRVEVFYDAETFIKRMESVGLQEYLNQKTERRWWSDVKFNHMTLREKVEHIFSANHEQTDYNQFHIELNNPIIIFDYNINKPFYKKTYFQFNADKWDGQSNLGYILESGRLSDYLFIKVFDPHSFVQELEMFMGNILIKRDPEPIFTDQDKIQSHGFDKKTSFRKGKSKK